MAPRPLYPRVSPLVLGGAVLVVVLGTLAFGYAIVEGHLLTHGILPNPTTLVIAITPEGPFTVIITDPFNEKLGQFNGSEPIQLPPGDYVVDVLPSSNGYMDKKLRVHLSNGQLLALPVVLQPIAPEPKPPEGVEAEDPAEPDLEPVAPVPPAAPPPGWGKLACTSKPPGAEIWIDGKSIGKKTPMAISTAHQLRAGKHSVVFKLKGKASAPVTFEIESEQTSVVKGVEIPGA